jgi:hypothetical protein
MKKNLVKARFGAAMCIALALLVPPVISAQSSLNAYRSDNSDWWSILRAIENGREPAYRPGASEPSPSNFEVLGLRLGYDKAFQHVVAKLGKSDEVERGDASTGRAQLCYTDADRQTYLIFEVGEVDLAFYIFRGGSSWDGRGRCARSDLVTPALRTASGLHLGQTKPEVEATLGTPTTALKDRLVYADMLQKRSSAADLAKLRAQNPNMSDKDFHENFDFYSLSTYIEVRFSHSRATYIVVSKSEVD